MSEEWAFCGRTKSTTRLNFDLPGNLSDNKFLLGSKARAEDLPAAIPRYSYVFVESLYYKVIQQGVINNLTHELLILDQKIDRYEKFYKNGRFPGGIYLWHG